MAGQKVGIITFHNADNLGAVLQAYALQEVLAQTCAAEPRIIDYRCEAIEQGADTGGKSLKTRLKAIPKSVYYAIKHSGFERFRRQYLLRTQPWTAQTVSGCAGEFDLFITGSDQVWNLECSGWDNAYFLDFVPEEKRKASYAASLGNYRYKKEEQPQIRQLLGRFQAISVREQSAAAHLADMGIGDVTVCPDPVVLLPESRWREIVPRRLCARKYILIYQIQPDVNVRRHAVAYARAHNCKIIDNKKSLEFILHNSPDEFLSWISHAECVFTNSFHATTFALIFNRPLGADVELAGGGVNHRVREMLERCGALSSVLRDGWQPAPEDAAAQLVQFREEGLAYLRKICAGV